MNSIITAHLFFLINDTLNISLKQNKSGHTIGAQLSWTKALNTSSCGSKAQEIIPSIYKKKCFQ